MLRKAGIATTAAVNDGDQQAGWEKRTTISAAEGDVNLDLVFVAGEMGLKAVIPQGNCRA